MRRTLALTLLLLVAVPSADIIRGHDRDDSRYRELGKGYDAVVDLNLPGGAGTLISPTWVITAAHAAQLMKAPHSVIIAGKAYGVTRTVMFPGGGEGKDDLALLELAQAVENVKPIPIYDGRDEATGDKMVVFVGQGYSGDGLSGPTVRDRLRRAATNDIQSVKKNWLVFLFDAPPAGTELEGISGPGDSGGPALMTIGATTYVVGVSSGQDSRATGKEGVYGVTEYYVRVSSYAEWIRETTAEVAHPR